MMIIYRLKIRDVILTFDTLDWTLWTLLEWTGVDNTILNWIFSDFRINSNACREIKKCQIFSVSADISSPSLWGIPNIFHGNKENSTNIYHLKIKNRPPTYFKFIYLSLSFLLIIIAFVDERLEVTSHIYCTRIHGLYMCHKKIDHCFQ